MMKRKSNIKKEKHLDENGNHIEDDHYNTSISNNKKLKTNEILNSISDSEVDNKARQKIFTYEPSQLYECFLFHGVPSKICDQFLEQQLDGKKFEKWPSDSEENFKKYLNENFKLNVGSAEQLSHNDLKHLLAILKVYKKNPFPKKYKSFGDKVHGPIPLHPLLVTIIDTPQFQRLRYLKQLGIIDYVFPSANHTRFEHSIGTSYLAGLLIKHLKDAQPSLRITYADELCVKIAGLCHDMGHGPFSHLFEEVIERFDNGGSTESWKHEMATLKLFDKMFQDYPDLIEQFECYGLFEDDRNLIKDMIFNPIFKKSNSNPEKIDEILRNLDSLKAKGLEKSFLFEIVSNIRTGIDVDKFDYFERDASNLGVKNHFDHIRYIQCTRVIKRSEDGLNQICVRDKEVNDLYELYHVRHILTKRAYKHHTGSSINLMVVEAFEKADKYFNFSTIFKGEDALKRYEQLNDHIFLQILYSTDETLNESKKIIERIHNKRDLYKHVSSVILPSPKAKEYCKKELQKSFIDFITYKKQNDSKYEVNIEDVVIELIRFNYGSRDKNPLENVRFYNKYNPNKSFPINKRQVSNMLLDTFEDNQLRIYSKKADYVSELSNLFLEWCEKNGYGKPLYGTN